ncbi:FxDxF family PEP-CTERM protein [Sphingomonas sp. LR60]|uniref:FxDxF family PEP-CTERM protein n=1 Tax=Sphingomonas sp. LR60 TaxID=3050233 RepID=UPI002FE33E47
MKKIFAAAVVAATVAVSAPAMAATNIPLTNNNGLYVGAFASESKTGEFTDVYKFTVPSAGFVGASLITLAFNLPGMDPMVNFVLTKVTLNGVDLTLTPTSTNNYQAESLSPIPSKNNPQSLIVKGTVTGGSATYGGNVAFRASAAVPEPGTWALMILGFGIVGYAMRRRPAVRFAQAI